MAVSSAALCASSYNAAQKLATLDCSCTMLSCQTTETHRSMHSRFKRRYHMQQACVCRDRVVMRACTHDPTNTDVSLRECLLLLQAVTLRRLKSSTFDGRPIIQLPQRIVNVNLAPFRTSEEREFYESVEKQTQV